MAKKKRKPAKNQKKKASGQLFKALRLEMFNLQMRKHTDKKVLPGQYAARAFVQSIVSSEESEKASKVQKLSQSKFVKAKASQEDKAEIVQLDTS